MRVKDDEFNDFIADAGRIKDPVLSGGAIKMAAPPLSFQPWRETGGFCVVAKYEIPGGRSYAVRCWNKDLKGAKERTLTISDFLKSVNLPYFVDFSYVEGGFFGEKPHPIVRMEWVEALSLHEWVAANLLYSRKIYALAARFVKMCADLHAAGISHGDLSLENLKVRSDDSLVLLDYDSLYHDSFGTLSDYIHGKPEFQHPLRSTNAVASNTVDNFSALVIYTSLLYFAANPDAFSRSDAMKNGDRLLFEPQDYRNFSASKIYRELYDFSPQTRFLAEKLSALCGARHLKDIPALHSVVKSSKIDLGRITPYQAPVCRLEYVKEGSTRMLPRYRLVMINARQFTIDVNHYSIKGKFQYKERIKKESLKQDAKEITRTQYLGRGIFRKKEYVFSCTGENSKSAFQTVTLFPLIENAARHLRRAVLTVLLLGAVVALGAVGYRYYEQETNYKNFMAQGDGLMTEGKYAEAVASYNAALGVRSSSGAAEQVESRIAVANDARDREVAELTQAVESALDANDVMLRIGQRISDEQMALNESNIQRLETLLTDGVQATQNSSIEQLKRRWAAQKRRWGV